MAPRALPEELRAYAARQRDPLELSSVDIDDLGARIASDGYAIGKGFVRADVFQRMQGFWLDFYRRLPREGNQPLVWSPYLGQQNTTGYTANSFNLLFRSYDFLWNPCVDETTCQVALTLNAIRNLMRERDLDDGLRYDASGYGIFVTTSRYPSPDGFMQLHKDSVDPTVRLIHYIVPLTFKGTHYALGGMVVRDRQGSLIDVDGRVAPGDVIFYDGTLDHGVERVGGDADSPGRIQMFSIPAIFSRVEMNDEVLRRIGLARLLSAKSKALVRSLVGRLRGKLAHRS